MIISLYNIEQAIESVRKYSDIEASVEEGSFTVTGAPVVLAEFEMALAIELARPNYGEPLRELPIRNFFVDLVEARKEVGATTDEALWKYETEVIGDIKAHEVRTL